MAINMNNHVFKGHKALLGSKYVTYGEVELPMRYELFQKSRSGFDWGNGGSGAIQLSFSMLFQLSNFDIASRNAEKFAMDIVRNLHTRDWLVSAQDVLAWLEQNEEIIEEKPVFKIQRKAEDNSIFVLEQIPEVHITKIERSYAEEPKLENIQINNETPLQEEQLAAEPEPLELLVLKNPVRKIKKIKTNVVKSICQELHITQKNLAEILEIPEGTVSSWAVKNEIPRLGKKAIEFYAMSTRNQKIVDSYKNLVHLLDVS